MKGKTVVALIVSSLVAVAQSNVFSASPRTTRTPADVLLRIRGGRLPRHSSIVELNSNYVDYDIDDKHVTLEREEQQRPYSSQIETISTAQTFLLFVAGSNQHLTYFQLIYRYLTHLNRTSPILFATTVACVSVFFAWQIPACHHFLERHFVCSRRNITAKRWRVTLLSKFSHSSLLHLSFNLSALLSFGPAVQKVLKHRGRSNSWSSSLWPLFTGAALAGSASFLLIEGGRGCGAMGLSDVTMALVAVYARFFPNHVIGFLVAGIFPVRMPASMFLVVMLLWSGLGTLISLRRPQRIAHSAHLGGLLFGMGYYELWHRRLQRALRKQRL